METNDARNQLRDVNRLRGAAIGESLRAPRWAFPLLGSAIVGFMSFCAFGPDRLVPWASGVWTLFMIGWAFAIRRANRARPENMPWRYMRPYLLIAIGITIASSVAVALAGRAAWFFVGLAFAAWGLWTGVAQARRARA